MSFFQQRSAKKHCAHSALRASDSATAPKKIEGRIAYNVIGNFMKPSHIFRKDLQKKHCTHSARRATDSGTAPKKIEGRNAHHVFGKFTESAITPFQKDMQNKLGMRLCRDHTPLCRPPVAAPEENKTGLYSASGWCTHEVCTNSV